MHFIKLGGDRYLIKDSHTIVNGKEKEELERKDLEELVSGDKDGDIKETEPTIPRHNKQRKAED